MTLIRSVNIYCTCTAIFNAYILKTPYWKILSNSPRLFTCFLMSILGNLLPIARRHVKYRPVFNDIIYRANTHRNWDPGHRNFHFLLLEKPILETGYISVCLSYCKFCRYTNAVNSDLHMYNMTLSLINPNSVLMMLGQLFS